LFYYATKPFITDDLFAAAGAACFSSIARSKAALSKDMLRERQTAVVSPCVGSAFKLVMAVAGGGSREEAARERNGADQSDVDGARQKEKLARYVVHGSAGAGMTGRARWGRRRRAR
jgi:hypothetical protein